MAIDSQTILITGAGGWLGSLLPGKLVELEPETSFKFVLADIVEPKIPSSLKGTKSECITIKADLSDDSNMQALFTTKYGKPDVIYSMHGIMSLGSEENWDLGMRVNVDSTRALLEKARHQKTKQDKPITFIFTSSVATYGGQLPDEVLPSTSCTPEGAYGTEKLICEYYVTEYTRKGFVNGISIKLPTIVPRPGPPSRATSAFVSGIVREPLAGQEAICPIGSGLEDAILQQTGVWVAKPSTTLANFVKAKQLLSNTDLSKNILPWSRSVQLPGFTVSVHDIIQALRNVKGDDAVALIKFEHDETCKRIVSSWPRAFDNSYALSLGFIVDQDGFEGAIKEYRANHM
ncbi:NAD-P-binding protein [Meira miltonrushii]|uniref:NAD-P-binding protein n=1 Tax=Meira miltonrushii TaxID=1280837 RepID=A0A316V674_9BASI|nr:NAD-P-binding protein [Meira miltonrushii]PWN32754.1 NAD-P-binding protein [Meira miltonrushii]